MREIVEEVLRVEEQAADILRKAGEEASRIRATSDAKATEITADAAKKAKALVQEALEAAKAEAAERKTGIITRAEKDYAKKQSDGTAGFERAVTAVMDILTRPEHLAGS